MTNQCEHEWELVPVSAFARSSVFPDPNRPAYETRCRKCRCQYDERELRALEELALVKALCGRASDALEDEFGTPENPAYGIEGPIHELITELRKAAQVSKSETLK
jgi:hypothetical protein